MSRTLRYTIHQLAADVGQTDDGTRHELSYGVKTDHVPQPWSEYIIVTDEWRRELEDYGWADEKAGTVRVPIDDAIKRYAQQRQSKQQGQPPQGQAPAAGAGEAPKEQTPSDSSSGQQTEQKHQ